MVSMKHVCRLLLCIAFSLLITSCALNIPVPEQDQWKKLSLDIPMLEQHAWKQLAAAADGQLQKAGAVDLHFKWGIPNERLLMLARLSEGQAVLYQIDRRANLEPLSQSTQISCYFKKGLFCTGPGESAPTLVVASGDDSDLWGSLEAHAASQIAKAEAFRQSSLAAQLNEVQSYQPMNLARHRHPFEWGGKYETVENAQAFLEAVSARGLPFRSSLPHAPQLGSNGNSWVHTYDTVVFKTTDRCVTLARSSSRTAKHFNHDFWAAETLEFQATYRWQQPIDWAGIDDIDPDHEGISLYGHYAGSFEGDGLTYVSGWSPSLITANASMFDPSEYSVAKWNAYFLLPDGGGLRERVQYAFTFLDIMCGKGP